MTPSLPTLSALYEKATPGRWFLCRDDAIASDYKGPLLGHQTPVDGPFVADCTSFDDSRRMKEQSAATAEFICALHAAFPALRALIEAAMRVRQIDNDPTARECERDAAIRDLGNALAPFTPPTTTARENDQ